MTKQLDDRKMSAYNSSYKKLAVQWLNEILCLVSSSVVADSLVLRNRQLLVAAKRQVVKKPILENFGGRNNSVTVTIYDFWLLLQFKIPGQLLLVQISISLN